MYLEKLLARIRKISLKNADSPTSRREPEDKFIGILSDDLRRLWVAWKRGEQKAEELDSYGKENFSSMSDEEVLLRRDEIEETMRQYLLARDEASLLEKCFWSSVCHDFPQIVTSQWIGIRQNWQVVEVDQAKKMRRNAIELLKQFIDREESDEP